MLKTKVALLASLSLMGCTTVYAPIPHQVEIKEDTSLSTTAVINHTFVRAKNSNYLICSQTSADAAFDQGDNAGLTGTLTNGASEGIRNQNSADDVEMSGRTPVLLMTRELLYRSCEFSANYQLNKDEAQALYEKTLTLIGNVWATEAGNTTITIADGLKTNAAQNISSSDTLSEQSKAKDDSQTSDDDDN